MTPRRRPARDSRGYPVNLRRRAAAAAWSSAPGGSRPARSSRCSRPAPTSHVVAPEVGDEVRALGRRRAAAARRARRSQPADLDGAWLAHRGHRRSRGQPRGVRRRRGPPGLGEQRPTTRRNCSFTLHVGRPPRATSWSPIGTGGRSPALATLLRRRLDEELGPEYETLLELLSRGPGSAARRGAFQRGRRLADGLRFRHRRPDPRRPRRRSQGAPAARVSRRRRSEPPHRAGRAARADDGARGARCPRRSHDLGGARAPRRGRACSPRATAPRSTPRCTHFHAAVGDVRDFLADYSGVDARRLRRPPLHVLRRRRGRAPVRASPPASTR